MSQTRRQRKHKAKAVSYSGLEDLPSAPFCGHLGAECGPDGSCWGSPQGKGSVLAAKAAETQGKGGVLATKAAKHTRQRRCLHVAPSPGA